jgi:hypothetical protein
VNLESEYYVYWPTWQEPDVLGFLAYQYWDEPPSAESHRFFDYAWKDLRQPKAGLQVFFGPDFIADDNLSGQVGVDDMVPVDFAVFGELESRWFLGCPGTVTGTLDFGDGSATQDVTLDLNEGTATHTYYVGGLATATLSIDGSACTSDPLYTLGTQATASIIMNVDGPIIGSGRDTSVLPAAFSVSKASPNPLSAASGTRLQLSLPEARATEVRVFDVLGREVRQLVDESLPAGVHDLRWDGTGAGGRAAPSGIYFLRIVSGSDEVTRKVFLSR